MPISRNMKDTPVTRAEVTVFTSPAQVKDEDCSILYCLSGTADISADGGKAVYTADSFLLLPQQHAAEIEPKPQAEILRLNISGSFVQDHLDRLTFPVISSEFDSASDYHALKQLILTLAGYLQEDQEERRLEINGTLFLILAEIEKLPHPDLISGQDSRFSDRMHSIAEYINLHYNEPLTLSQLAQVFYLTPQYLSTFFQKSFRVNFKSYLTERRLFYSLRDLRNTHLTVSEIALRNGFSSISAYRRNFQKAYGISPSDYRTAFLRDQGTGSGAGFDLPGSAISEKKDAIGMSARIQVSRTPVIRENVNRMINIGSVQSMLSEQFRTKLIGFTSESGIRYIRIQGMLSGSFIPMVLPHYEYYFLNVDTVLTFLYANQLVPFIELTRLPVLASEAGEGQEYYIPRGKRFLKLLESFLLHVTRRWPHSWLALWKFELWMTPRDTPAVYARDFKAIRDLIVSYIPGAAVGGPGFQGAAAGSGQGLPAGRGKSADALTSLIHAFRASGVKPDFFSLHLSYTIRSGGNRTPGVSLAEDLPAAACRNVRKQLHSHGFELPLYVTEWTSADHLLAPVACSRYQAAFIAKTFLELSSVCDLAAYWLFCDLMLPEQNMADAPLTVFGSGLLSSGFLPYAPYYAWTFCAQLGTEVIGEGKNYRVVREGTDHYKVIAWHYEHFRSGSEAYMQDVTAFDRIYDLFREAAPQLLNISLEGLTKGLYHVSRLMLGEYNGSLLDILIGEYTHSNIDKVDFLQNIQVLSGYGNSFRLKACVPEERCSYTQVDEALQLRAELPAHTVCLWDIRRQV